MRQDRKSRSNPKNDEKFMIVGESVMPEASNVSMPTLVFSNFRCCVVFCHGTWQTVLNLDTAVIRENLNSLEGIQVINHNNIGNNQYDFSRLQCERKALHSTGWRAVTIIKFSLPSTSSNALFAVCQGVADHTGGENIPKQPDIKYFAHLDVCWKYYEL